MGWTSVMVYFFINSFSIAVIKHNDQGNLRRKGFIWLTVPEGEERLITTAGESGDRRAGW